MQLTTNYRTLTQAFDPYTTVAYSETKTEVDFEGFRYTVTTHYNYFNEVLREDRVLQNN